MSASYTSEPIRALLYARIDTASRWRALPPPSHQNAVEFPSSPGDSSRGGVKTETRRFILDARNLGGSGPRGTVHEIAEPGSPLTLMHPVGGRLHYRTIIST